MIVSRHDFLEATTAFTAANLFFPVASAPIDADHLQGTHWRQVWFGRESDGELNGIDHYALPANLFLTFSERDREKLRNAKPGAGLAKMQSRTTHILPALDGSWG